MLLVLLGGALAFVGFLGALLAGSAVLPIDGTGFLGLCAAGVGALVVAFWRDPRAIEIRRAP